MKVKLDENLGSACGGILRDRGHDVSTALEQGLISSTDAAVMDACLRERRVLVSKDLDFADPRQFPPDKGPGIVVLRFGARAGRSEVETAIRRLAKALESEEVAGKLWVLRGTRVREFRRRG